MKDPQEFEEEVRRVARALWDADPGEGNSVMIDGRERDFILDRGGVDFYVECTTESSLKKIKHDAEKMVQYRERQARTGRAVSLWIITLKDPTATQGDYCASRGIKAMSLREFRRMVFDAEGYVELRGRSAFGSARDPSNDSSDVSNLKYVPTAMRYRGTSLTAESDAVADALQEGKVVVLLGDYGMGKSLMVRRIYLELSKRYKADSGNRVPVAINLRDHWNLDRPQQVIESHARDIGVAQPISIVRGLNAGRLIPLLDGFDETAAVPWGSRDIRRLRDARRKATEIIRRFVDCTRGRTGILVAGRPSFFDTPEELASSLGISPSDVVLTMGEFTEDEATRLLKLWKLDFSLPEWLPRRPLLLASLLAKGSLSDLAQGLSEMAPSRAWNALVDDICRREEKIHDLLDARAIRSILEELASRSRATPTGLGPITEDDIASAFRRQIGAQPDLAAWPLLMRLPGLAARDGAASSRYFVDDSLLSAYRAGTLTNYITTANLPEEADLWKHGIDELGAQVASAALGSGAVNVPSMIYRAKDASLKSLGTLALDVIQVARFCSIDDQPIDCKGLDISDANSPELDLLLGSPIKRLTIRDSHILRLTAGDTGVDGLKVINCLIDELANSQAISSTTSWIDPSCIIGSTDADSPNAQVMHDNSIPLPVRVLITIINKLYKKHGSERKENAFSRGITQQSSKYVPDILAILRSEGIATSRTVSGVRMWSSVRTSRERALTILGDPVTGSDAALIAARGLK